MDTVPEIEEFIERARVARLATANSESKPHLVPVVFVFDDNYFFIPVDEKRKKTVKPEKVMGISIHPASLFLAYLP